MIHLYLIYNSDWQMQAHNFLCSSKSNTNSWYNNSSFAYVWIAFKFLQTFSVKKGQCRLVLWHTKSVFDLSFKVTYWKLNVTKPVVLTCLFIVIDLFVCFEKSFLNTLSWFWNGHNKMQKKMGISPTDCSWLLSLRLAVLQLITF